MNFGNQKLEKFKMDEINLNSIIIYVIRYYIKYFYFTCNIKLNVLIINTKT